MLTVRRLPGIAFQAETPPLVDLPRMDVAAFVGFARRGPVHTPVPVEDEAAFEDIFGGAYRLAWDDATATWQTACLAPAVKAFFAQGGRRCWIVRVAHEQAAVNSFPLAGLLQTEAGGYRGVAATARSAGSWSDGLQVRAGALLDPLTFTTSAIQPGRPDHSFLLTLLPRWGQRLQAGDMLQLDGSDGRHRAYIAIGPADLRPGREAVEVTAHRLNTYWFRRLDPAGRGKLTGTVRTVAPALAADATGTLDPAAGILATKLAAEAGDWLRLETAGQVVWLLVGSARADKLHISQAWLEGAQPGGGALAAARLLRLQLALQVREEPDYFRTLPGLACAAPHPRFIGYLPADAALFDPGLSESRQLLNHPASALWAEVKQPRFPLGLALPEQTIIPLGLDATPPWRGALSPRPEPSLARDGLVPPTGNYYRLNDAGWAAFVAGLFIDPALATASQRSLMSEANDRFYMQGRPLTGLHALLLIDEVSLVALPDAAQRGWRLAEGIIEPAPPEPPAPPDPCARDSAFKPKRTVQAAAGDKTVQVPQLEGNLWKLLPPAGFDPTGLLAVDLAAARLAAARGDMVAILGLPKHYTTPDVLRHQRQLAAELQLAGDSTASYVALYHPWLITREHTGHLLHTHPAGSICGVIAARSIARGAWVAPANEVLHDALATLPALSLADQQAFYRAGVNPIVPDPRGFVIWGSFTQSPEAELEELNVRWLLILLKRFALREGQGYIFAPHGPAFRRRVKQQFEQFLARLFSRGAFSGRVPAEAYQVVIDDTINTRSDVEQGRFVVELRVAPAQPVTFITVRLVQFESGLLAVQEVAGSVH